MSVEEIEEVINKWEIKEITLDQIIGKMLVMLRDLSLNGVKAALWHPLSMQTKHPHLAYKAPPTKEYGGWKVILASINYY